MALTIGPVVYGAGLRAKGLALYVLVSTLAAASVGAILGALGMVLGPTLGQLALIVGAGGYTLTYLIHSRFLELQLGPQMPQRWIALNHPMRTVAHFAFVLGLTYATPVRAGTVIALGAIVWIIGSPLAAAVLFALMAGIRNLPVLWASYGRQDPASRISRVLGFRGVLLMADACVLSALLVGAVIVVLRQTASGT